MAEEMVSVGCKLPYGLVLELDTEKKEPVVPGSDKLVKVFYPSGDKVTIAGSNSAHPDTGNPGRVVAGYGITDVPAKFWNEWVAQHAAYPLLVNGTLFAHPKADATISEAGNRRSLKTGLEQMDPDKPGPGLTKDTTQP
jgi:hypothetical protein